MKIIVIISLLLLCSCSVKEIEPETIENYFLGSTIINPITLPTTKDLSGNYTLSRTAVDLITTFNFEASFNTNQISIREVDSKKMKIEFPSNCILNCSNTINTTNRDGIYSLLFEISGFEIKIPNQTFPNGIGGDKFYITEGIGKISKAKDKITLSYIIQWGGTQKARYNYTFNRKP